MGILAVSLLDREFKWVASQLLSFANKYGREPAINLLFYLFILYSVVLIKSICRIFDGT